MIFSLQRYLEDYFNSAGFRDPDQYSVALARLYDRKRGGNSADSFLNWMRRLKTAFYRVNVGIKRQTFERKLLIRLDGKFKKKEYSSFQRSSPKELKHRAFA